MPSQSTRGGPHGYLQHHRRRPSQRRGARADHRLTCAVPGPSRPKGAAWSLLGRERAITVWDSPEDRDRFLAERLAPAYQAVGRSLNEVTRTQFDVDMLVAGDLAGMAPQLVGTEG